MRLDEVIERLGKDHLEDDQISLSLPKGSVKKLRLVPNDISKVALDLGMEIPGADIINDGPFLKRMYTASYTHHGRTVLWFEVQSDEMQKMGFLALCNAYNVKCKKKTDVFLGFDAGHPFGVFEHEDIGISYVNHGPGKFNIEVSGTFGYASGLKLIKEIFYMDMFTDGGEETAKGENIGKSRIVYRTGPSDAYFRTVPINEANVEFCWKLMEGFRSLEHVRVNRPILDVNEGMIKSHFECIFRDLPRRDYSNLLTLDDFYRIDPEGEVLKAMGGTEIVALMGGDGGGAASWFSNCLRKKAMAANESGLLRVDYHFENMLPIIFPPYGQMNAMSVDSSSIEGTARSAGDLTYIERKKGLDGAPYQKIWMVVAGNPRFMRVQQEIISRIGGKLLISQ